MYRRLDQMKTYIGIGLLLVGQLAGLSRKTLYAQTPDPTIFQPVQPQKQLRAVRATGALTIDGRLDEADWQLAQPGTGFFQAQPEQGKTPANDTRVRVLFDNKNIYVGAFCPDSLGRKALRVPDLRRDFDYFANDFVGVSFDPFRDQRNAQVFQTNPFGAQRDLLCTDDALFDGSGRPSRLGWFLESTHHPYRLRLGSRPGRRCGCNCPGSRSDTPAPTAWPKTGASTSCASADASTSKPTGRPCRGPTPCTE